MEESQAQIERALEQLCGQMTSVSSPTGTITSFAVAASPVKEGRAVEIDFRGVKDAGISQDVANQNPAFIIKSIGNLAQFKDHFNR